MASPEDFSPPAEPKRLPPLLRRAWYGLNQAFRQRIAHLELTPDQFSILRWLSEGDPQGMTQRTLSDLMTSDPNTITSTLSRMEAARLITRAPHEHDGRAHRVRLLPEGQELFERAKRTAIGLQEQVLDVLPPDRREGFLHDLAVLGEACALAAEKPPRKRP
jgi:DNA-binding MarR family transcriptional regulator